MHEAALAWVALIRANFVQMVISPILVDLCRVLSALVVTLIISMAVPNAHRVEQANTAMSQGRNARHAR